MTPQRRQKERVKERDRERERRKRELKGAIVGMEGRKEQRRITRTTEYLCVISISFIILELLLALFGKYDMLEIASSI